MTSPRRSVTWPLLGALAAAFCLALPAQAAVPATASLSLTGLEIPSAASLSGHALLLGVKPSVTSQFPEGWEFRADHVHIEAQNDQGPAVLGAGTYAQPHPDTREFGPTYGFTTSVGIGPYLTVVAQAPMTVGVQLPSTLLDAVANVHFANEASSNVPKLSGTGVDAPAVDLAQPAVETRVTGGAPVVLHGDFQMFVYSFNFTLKPDDGVGRSYSTGFHSSPLVNGVPKDVPDPARSAVGNADDGRATLILTNATFTYRPGAAPYQLDLADAALGLAGSVRLHDAQGSLDAAGQATQVQATTMVLDFASGAGTIRPAAGTGDARMEGRFSGSLSQYVIDGRTVVPQAVVAGGSVARGWALPAAIAATLGVAVLALVVRRRRNGVDALVLQAEEAFLGGRFQRALTASSRAARRAPMDMDAVVLRCLARLRLGEPQRAAAEIDGLLGAERQPGDPGTLHLLLSMCRMESGEEEGAQKALARALAIRPDLAEEVRRSPLFRRVLEHPELRALLGQDPAASYA